MNIEEINSLIDKGEKRDSFEQSELVKLLHYVGIEEAKKRQEYKSMEIKFKARVDKQRIMQGEGTKWKADGKLANEIERMKLKINEVEYLRTLYGNLKDSIKESINYWKFIQKI